MSIQRLPASGSIRPVCRPKALETPASVALGRLAAGQSDEARLLFAVELATVLPLRRASVQGRLKTLAAVLFANPGDGRLAGLDRLGDPFVHPSFPFRTLIGLQQDAGVSELAGGGGARGDEPLQIVSFGIAEDDWISLLHNGRSVPAVSLCNQIKRNGLLKSSRRLHPRLIYAGRIGSK